MTSDDKRKAALDALTAYADELRTEIERQTTGLKHDLANVEQSIRVLLGDKTQDMASVETRVGLDIGKKYAGVGPQAAVEDFIGKHPEQTFRSGDVADQLKADGFTVPNPKLLKQQILIALDRAVKKGVAIEIQIEGRRAFRLK